MRFFPWESRVQEQGAVKRRMMRGISSCCKTRTSRDCGEERLRWLSFRIQVILQLSRIELLCLSHMFCGKWYCTSGGGETAGPIL